MGYIAIGCACIALGIFLIAIQFHPGNSKQGFLNARDLPVGEPMKQEEFERNNVLLNR